MKKENVTHKVIDETLHEDEGQDCFVGTHQECADFVSEQNTVGLTIVPLSKEEFQIHNGIEEVTTSLDNIVSTKVDEIQKAMQLKFKNVLEADSFDNYWFSHMKCDLPPFEFTKNSINNWKISDQCLINTVSNDWYDFEEVIGTTLYHVLMKIIEYRIWNGYPKQEDVENLILQIPGVNYFLLENEVKTSFNNFKPILLHTVIYDMLENFEEHWNEIVDMLDVHPSDYSNVSMEIPVKLYFPEAYVDCVRNEQVERHSEKIASQKLDNIITFALRSFMEENDYDHIPVVETYGTILDVFNKYHELNNNRTIIIVFLKKSGDDSLVRLIMIVNNKCSNCLKYEFDKDENKFIFTLDVNGQDVENEFSKGKNFYGPFASDGSLFSKTVLDLRSFLRYKDDWIEMFPNDKCWQFVEGL